MEKFTFEIEGKLDDAIKQVGELTESIENLQETQKDQVKELQEQIKKLEKENKKTTGAVTKLAKGFKGVGLAMKAAGIGIIVAIFNKLTEAMMRNQQFADAVEQVFTAIGIVFSEVSSRLMEMFGRVNEATGGFDALKGVIGGALTVALNSLLIVIQGVTYGVKQLEYAWNYFFGSAADVKKSKESLRQLEADMEETANRIKEGGKDIADNFVEAVGEVGTLAEGIVKTTAEAINEIDAESAMSSAKRVVENKKNYGLLESMSARLIEKYDLEAETQRQVRDDVSKSIEERIAANKRLGEILDEQASEEKKQIGVRIAAIKEQIRLEGESHELTQQLYDLNTEMIAIDAKVAGFKSEQLTNEIGLKQELQDMNNAEKEGMQNLAFEQRKFMAEQETDLLKQLDLKKQILAEEQAAELQRLDEIRQNLADGTQAKIDADLAYAEAEQTFKQEAHALDGEIAEEVSARKAKALQEEETLAATKKALVQQGLDAVINAAGAESKVGKALFIAKQMILLKETIMKAKAAISDMKMNAATSAGDLAKGSGKAASSAPPPFNLIPIAMFAAQAIGIVASIKKAMQKTKQATAEVGAGGGSVGSIEPPQAGGGSAMPSFNLVGGSATNQLAEAIGGQSQEPVKAYVVTNEVTSAQSLERNIVETTSL